MFMPARLVVTSLSFHEAIHISLNSDSLHGIGIYLSNTPAAVNDATATTALYLLLATFRQFTFAEYSLRQQNWKPRAISSKTHDITGKTLAILGLGGIGLRFAALAHAFPMHIIYHSRHKKADAPEYCKYFDDVEEMLRQADVLSIHVPLRSETVGLVGKKWIGLLRPGAVIINTARGKIIDEEAMVQALEDGHVCTFPMGLRSTDENSSSSVQWDSTSFRMSQKLIRVCWNSRM